VIYKSEHRLTEEIFLLSQLYLVAASAISDNGKKKLLKPIDDLISKLVKEHSSKPLDKFKSKIANLNFKLGIVKLIAESVHGLKYILIIYSVAKMIIEAGYKLPEYVVEAFEPFLEVENEQKTLNGKEISDKDWLNIKNSADKTAKKIFEQLRESGYYLT